jgi:hypothetical protein
MIIAVETDFSHRPAVDFGSQEGFVAVVKFEGTL